MLDVSDKSKGNERVYIILNSYSNQSCRIQCMAISSYDHMGVRRN